MKIAPTGAIERRRQQPCNSAFEGFALNLKGLSLVHLSLAVHDAAHSSSQRTGQDLQLFRAVFKGLPGAI
jgi:hypothetical protein